MYVVVPGEDLVAAVLRRHEGIRANGYITCTFQLLTTLLELLQVGYSVLVFACHFAFLLFVILNVMKEKGGDIRTPVFLLSECKGRGFLFGKGDKTMLNVEC